jgi:SAM-dependent methyltransferase
MAQNIYDDPEFFANYGQLPRSIDGLDAAAEWPTLQTMLPPMDGLRVVDLGCGYGWFCRWAAEAGAASVLGLDISERMLARAAADTSDARISYRREDLGQLVLSAEAFDLAYSSLTLHYLTDLGRLFGEVRHSLVAGGTFVFSAEHPLYTAPSRPAFVEHDGHTVWPLDDYLVEGPRTTNWLADGVVKQHRTIGTYVTALVANGFRVTHLVEWGPSDVQIVEHPEWDVERHRSPFLLVAASAA